MNWPLMRNNITRQDRLAASNFFLEGGVHDLSDTRMTQGPQVAAFEREFAAWLGIKYAVMVNSGSSANLITLSALRELRGGGEIIVPTITWASDISAVIHAGFHPIFVDIDPSTLGMGMAAVFRAITTKTKAVFVTHVLGFNALTAALRDELEERDIPIIEDCCEALGASFNGGKLGTFGLASNFSFYYAHHLSTIEGGMVCTDDEKFYQCLRQFRAHGLVRERTDEDGKRDLQAASQDLDPQFIFSLPGYNVRSTEINAVIGRSQLKRLDANNALRTSNLLTWLSHLDSARYVTQYRVEGSSSYALPLVLQKPDTDLMKRVLELLDTEGIEYRRGTAGGGNQLRQPYLRRIFGNEYEKYPQAEHVHLYGLYIGNYPDLDPGYIIRELCLELNAL